MNTVLDVPQPGCPVGPAADRVPDLPPSEAESAALAAAPAPYLGEVAPLSARLARLAEQPSPTPAEQRELGQAIDAVCRNIRAARAAWMSRQTAPFNVAQHLRQRALDMLRAGLPVATVVATLKLQPEQVLVIEDEIRAAEQLLRTHRRCPGCGGLVQSPCRLCGHRQLAVRRDGDKGAERVLRQAGFDPLPGGAPSGANVAREMRPAWPRDTDTAPPNPPRDVPARERHPRAIREGGSRILAGQESGPALG